MRLFRIMANKKVMSVFIAIFLVIIVWFGLSYSVFKNSVAKFSREVSESNNVIFTKNIDSFDTSFKDINNLIHSINMLPYESLNSSEEDGHIDMGEVYEMQKHINILVSSASINYIEEALVFFKGSDFVITSTGTISLQDLFSQKYKHPSYNYQFWKSFASKNHSLKVFPESFYSVFNVDDNHDKQRRLMVVAGNNNLSNKNVMILIDVEKLFKHVLDTMVSGESLIILDQSRNVILSTEDDWDLVEVIEDMSLSAGRETTLKNQNYDYNLYKSDYNDFMYINKEPRRLKNNEMVARVNQLMILMFLICGLLFASIFSLYLFRLMRSTAHLFGHTYKSDKDFSSIFSKVLKLQKENQAYQSQMVEVMSQVQKGTFFDVLDEYSPSSENRMKIEQYFAGFLESEMFVLALIKLKPNDNKTEISSIKIKEITNIIQSRLKEKLGNGIVFHAGQLQFLSLINIQQAQEREIVVQEMSTFRLNLLHLKEFNMLSAVSRAYPAEIQNCRLAYRDLMESMAYRNLKSTHSVIESESIQFTWNIYFPLFEIDKLSNCLISNDESDGTDIIKRIIQINVERNIHHHQLVTISKCLFSHMIKHIDVDKVEQNEMMIMETKFNQKVEHAFEVYDIQEALLRIYRKVSNNCKSDPSSNFNPKFIARYINLHYMENLYLDHMAEIVGTSPKYFSNYFKRNFDVNYVEYLTKVRITHAKEFLKKTDLSVGEIGIKVGFQNATTFTNTFRKYCGITPSHYRKNHQAI